MNIMFAALLGGWEIVLILAVVLILFGAKKLPELAKGLGQGIKEFKKATSEVRDEITTAMDETPPPPPPKRLPANGTQPEAQPTVSQSPPATKA
jgi:sec-independent protein translocase protein TatA